MHPYLPNLLSDIAGAHREDVPEETTCEQSFEEHIEEVERYLAGDETKHTLGYYFGLEPLDFPPVEQFAENELKQVCDAFEELSQSWNIGIELPKNLPLPFRYQLMVGLLKEKFAPPRQGTLHFDFCTGYAPDCDLKKYCPCLEPARPAGGFWNELDDNELLDGDELNDEEF